MPGAGLQGAAGGSGSHRAGSWDCSPPAASLRRRRLARRPGYMRSTAGPGIRFPAVDTPFQDLRGVGSKELHHSASRAGQSNLGRSSHDREPLLGSCVPNSSKTPAVASVGHRSLAQTSAGGSPMGFWIHPRAGTGLPARLAGLRGPNDAWGQQESLSMDSSAAPGTSQDPTLCAGARGAGASRGQAPLEGCGSSRSLGSGPAAPHTLPGSCESFTSSFSFIRLSLGSAGERGEAEGCLPSREAETTHQSPQEMGVRATSPDRSHEDPPGLPQPFRLTAAQGLADLAQVLEKSSGPECGLLSSLNMDTGCSSSLDPSLAGCGCDEGSGSGDVHGWDTLLKRWEPVLRDSLLSTRRHLEVTSLRVKLQKLQEAVIEDDDFDKAEVLKQRLEDLERESGGLQLGLPSRQPALHSFLGHLAVQAQAILQVAAQQACSEDTQAPPGGEPWPREPTAQDGLRVTAARRDWLLGERQQLQKEMEALQTRLSVLEAEDQRLGRELEEQEQLLRGQGCGVTEPMARLPLGQLQALGKALQDMLAAAGRLHFQAEPPEDITSLQERIKSLNLSLKEVTTEVCTSGSLCSRLRRRVSHLETRLPALHEAKALAISGGHFCTAKDLAEEIRSLGSEREELEALLGKLLGLSSRSTGKLGHLREDQDRLCRELACQTAAYEASVKEKTVKYMEVLEGNLRSCENPLLQKVWVADLEACRLLLQSLKLQEAVGSPCAEDEGPRDGLSWAQSGDQGKALWQASPEWRAHHTPELHCAGEQKEESYILSAELEEQCEAIGRKLLDLEDALHTAMHSHDGELIQSLKGELQMVKEALQAMILPLQTATEEAGGGEAAASCPAAGVLEAQPEGRGREEVGHSVIRVDSGSCSRGLTDVPGTVVETQSLGVSQRGGGRPFS
ncbi:disrupted in schizophrenia 1 protein isoform X1 [Marmota marmota marmota]|uniref:disrupted in schizophrenia 1 protein isoform X1 n=1 Tax=Marmota marmota marmota TaxID=9994 RepID=UPI002092BF45|nr:disrupted in schizophrenia 1 protein isoform X1 [Marmota marmota marmota]